MRRAWHRSWLSSLAIAVCPTLVAACSRDWGFLEATERVPDTDSAALDATSEPDTLDAAGPDTVDASGLDSPDASDTQDASATDTLDASVADALDGSAPDTPDAALPDTIDASGPDTLDASSADAFIAPDATADTAPDDMGGTPDAKVCLVSPDNLLKDPSFEIWFGGSSPDWQPRGATGLLTRTTENVAHCASAGVFSAGGYASILQVVKISPPVPPDGFVTVRARARWVAGSTNPPGIILTWKTSNDLVNAGSLFSPWSAGSPCGDASASSSWCVHTKAHRNDTGEPIGEVYFQLEIDAQTIAFDDAELRVER